MIKRLTLLEVSEKITDRDGSEYIYRFSLVDTSLIGMPEENYYTSIHKIKVFISGRMEASWLAQQSDINFIKVCYEFAKRELIQKVKDGSIREYQELEITSTNYPNECPFQSDKIDMSVGKFENFEVVKKVMEDVKLIQLASDIIDLRDFINAIIKERHGKKLFQYSEERDIFQMFRDATNIEDFVYRVSALKLFATNFNEELLREITGNQNRQDKTITLLEQYLKTFNNYDEVAIKTIRSINRFRQMYPIHGDNIEGVQDAHTYFQIEYPVLNPSNAWKNILNSYRDALSRIFEIIK
jgi:hypothetical protein